MSRPRENSAAGGRMQRWSSKDVARKVAVKRDESKPTPLDTHLSEMRISGEASVQAGPKDSLGTIFKAQARRHQAVSVLQPICGLSVQACQTPRGTGCKCGGTGAPVAVIVVQMKLFPTCSFPWLHLDKIASSAQLLIKVQEVSLALPVEWFCFACGVVLLLITMHLFRKVLVSMGGCLRMCLVVYFRTCDLFSCISDWFYSCCDCFVNVCSRTVHMTCETLSQYNI